MKILMGSCFEMHVSVRFYVFCFCLVCFFIEITALQNVKIWKPNNNILNKQNWINPDSDEHCSEVEFGEYNTAPIYVDKLTAEEFVLPYTGEINILDGGYLKIVDPESKEKFNCLKLKGLEEHHYLDPSNWKSDVSSNPAVPDKEKLPCKYDTVELPNKLYSGINMDNLEYHLVSSIIFGNKNMTREDMESDGIIRLLPIQTRCSDPSGCVCTSEKEIHCPPSKTAECLNPIHPLGFCHPICGAYVTFKPTPGFKLKNIEESLKEYSDVFTHVSKVDDNLIQVVFAEKEYSGDSVLYAEEFLRKLHTEKKKFRISDLTGLKASGAQTNGGSSLGTVLLSSLLFVLGIFAFIFCIYGDRRWLTNFRFRTPSSFPLTSTYRARFSSREDESGLIFDTQSIAGSVLNLRQSFDNPMFSETSKNEEKIEKIDTNEAAAEENKSNDHLQNDPLYDLKKLNGELHEEIGADVVEIAEDIQNSGTFKTPLVGDISPLIEIEEVED